MQPPVYYYSVEISHLSGIAFGLTSSGGNKTILLFVGFKSTSLLSPPTNAMHMLLNHAGFCTVGWTCSYQLVEIFFSSFYLQDGSEVGMQFSLVLPYLCIQVIAPNLILILILTAFNSWFLVWRNTKWPLFMAMFLLQSRTIIKFNQYGFIPMCNLFSWREPLFRGLSD